MSDYTHRAPHSAIADGLGLTPMAAPETCHHNFDHQQIVCLPRFGSPMTCARSGEFHYGTD